MIQYIAIALFLLLCCINIWLIIYFLKSGGKKTPFIASFGKPKLETIKQADLFFLQKNPKAKTVDLGCGSGSILIPLAKNTLNIIS